MSSLRARQAAMPKVSYSITTLGAMAKNQATYPGGLDQVTPSLALQPGALRDSINFEVSVNGGYGRIAGYERVDGRPAPSDAGFSVIEVDGFTNIPAVGDAVNQLTSAASGVVAAIQNGPDNWYMVLTKLSGTPDFTHAWQITSGSLAIGTAIAPSISLTAQQTAQYTAAAADIYRADIGAPTGSGAILGVLFLNDEIFAFRDNVGGTATDIWKATTSGWTTVTLYNTVAFTAGGTAEPADGETLTQGGVTATVKRVMTQSGSWVGTAAGVFVVTNPAGGNFAAGAATLTGGGTVTLSGAQAAITLQPGGNYEFSKGNFFGQAATRRAYGCDGANKAFEFDGTVYAPISTGLTDDRPNHIAVHKGFLFVSFGSSALYSSPISPYRWSSVDGGGEIAQGDDITGFLTLPGNQSTATLAIFQHQTTSFLYGTDPSTWQEVTYNTGVGARPGSMQNLFDSFSFDDMGVVTLQSTLNFGNFNSATLTRNILPFIQANRTLVATSAIDRTKGQYRVFFSNGYALYLTVANGTYLGAAPVLFPNAVTCADCDKTSEGEEVCYIGSASGYVYQMEKGTSFDGADITAFVTLAWDALKSPRVRKRFRAASIEVSGDSYAAIEFGYALGYGTPAISQPSAIDIEANFSAAPQWDGGITWDSGFIWDGQTLSPSDVDMTGTAENVQVTLRSGTNYIAPYQINSIVYHWSARRGIRV